MPPTRLAAVAVALALAVTGCSGGDDDDDAKDADADVSSAEFAKADVELQLAKADLVSPHKALSPIDDATKTAVTGVVEDLLQITSAGPLSAGRAGGGFADLFTPDAGARAAGRDRDVVFDEEVPRFGELRQERATLELMALAGSMDPATSLVVAVYDWAVTSVERPSDRIERKGELHLIRDGGEWKIGAYVLAVTRTVDGETTTTTADNG